MSQVLTTVKKVYQFLVMMSDDFVDHCAVWMYTHRWKLALAICCFCVSQY